MAFYCEMRDDIGKAESWLPNVFLTSMWYMQGIMQLELKACGFCLNI